MAMNFEQARQNMVENQVRPWEVLDARVLEALAHVPRENFVDPAHRQLAFADVCLPLGHGEVMMKPVVEGRVLQALELKANDRVLEIGTGSGFLTACLAYLGGQVTSVEVHADLSATAAARLQALAINNAQLLVGEAVKAWQPDDLFDVIVVTGATHRIPERFFSWLKPGGRLLGIRGDSPVQQVVLSVHEGQGRHREEILFETDLPYLAHAEPPQQFEF